MGKDLSPKIEGLYEFQLESLPQAIQSLREKKLDEDIATIVRNYEDLILELIGYGVFEWRRGNNPTRIFERAIEVYFDFKEFIDAEKPEFQYLVNGALYTLPIFLNKTNLPLIPHPKGAFHAYYWVLNRYLAERIIETENIDAKVHEEAEKILKDSDQSVGYIKSVSDYIDFLECTDDDLQQEKLAICEKNYSLREKNKSRYPAGLNPLEGVGPYNPYYCDIFLAAIVKKKGLIPRGVHSWLF